MINEDHAWVLFNGEAVFHGTMEQCHAYVMLLAFGPDDLVQIQTVVFDGPFD